ncbi:MAG: D-glycero-beta-D-manno-heptose-7-phosphate kinase [Pseudomonadota bacterium]
MRVNKLKGCVLCIGDLMLDVFVEGKVSRISPEAPIPVLNYQNELRMPGGAGNVARNIISLGGTCVLVALHGDDKNAEHLKTLLKKDGVIYKGILDGVNPTTTKTRFVANGQQLLRFDYDANQDVALHIQEMVIETIQKIDMDFDSVVVSDYGKGLLNQNLLNFIFKFCADKNIPVIVDPKGDDFSKYKGADYITPNRQELFNATRLPVDNEEQIENACRYLVEQHQIKSVLATRSEQGMSLYKNKKIQHFLSKTHDVYDVAGAGDTVVATFAMALSSGMNAINSAYLANYAGGIVVEKKGTASIKIDELATALTNLKRPNKKANSFFVPFLSKEELAKKIRFWRQAGEKIAFTNGCFDVVHPGHLHILRKASKHAYRLVVGLNSDVSVKALKGKNRPVQNQNIRAEILSSMSFVDAVCIFDEQTPENLIFQVKPDLLIKGADYQLSKVVGADFVKSYGGEVVLIKMLQNYSTTNFINQLIDSQSLKDRD